MTLCMICHFFVASAVARQIEIDYSFMKLINRTEMGIMTSLWRIKQALFIFIPLIRQGWWDGGTADNSVDEISFFQICIR